MRWLVLTVPLATTPVLAADETQQTKVLSCLSDIGRTTEWNTCLNLMFEPCEGETVGSEVHVACLFRQRLDWNNAKIATEGQVLKRLSEPGVEELGKIMLGWPGFVKDKCQAVAESRAEISFDAARLGCEVSEYALVTHEFHTCLDGRSNETYCDLKGE